MAGADNGRIPRRACLSSEDHVSILRKLWEPDLREVAQHEILICTFAAQFFPKGFTLIPIGHIAALRWTREGLTLLGVLSFYHYSPHVGAVA